MRNITAGTLLLGSLLLCATATGQTINNTDFNVTGEILPGVCRIAVADVDLGSYQATQFTGAFATPFQPIDVVVSQCDPLISRVNLRFDGAGDGSNVQLFQGVQGVGIELQWRGTGVRIVPGGNIQMATAAGTHGFRARFLQSAPTVAAGKVTRPMTVSMTYD
ncbi:fimbrial protein [Stenotrophomonas maltophilia]|uniref:fimbrial protein n=1 Tax=Stenotrophomonas maltophilia TaxID=40324 RepID=UPI0039C47F0C